MANSSAVARIGDFMLSSNGPQTVLLHATPAKPNDELYYKGLPKQRIGPDMIHQPVYEPKEAQRDNEDNNNKSQCLEFYKNTIITCHKATKKTR